MEKTNVTSRREKYYLPSRRVNKKRRRCTVPSRPVQNVHTHRPVLPLYFSLFWRPVFKVFRTEHVTTVPSPILPARKSLESSDGEVQLATASLSNSSCTGYCLSTIRRSFLRLELVTNKNTKGTHGKGETGKSGRDRNGMGREPETT